MAHRPQWVVDHDHKCGGSGGKRWTNPSAEKMSGPADQNGVIGRHGAPRWKQRALYDAMKYAAGAAGQVRLARLSIYDQIDGHLCFTVGRRWMRRQSRTS